MRILLVEDDEFLAESTARALRSQSWVVDVSARGEPVPLSLREDRYDLLIAYFHKIFAPETHQPNQVSSRDVFHICRTYQIPLLLVVSTALQDKAAAMLESPPDIVRFVDPAETLQVALDLLKGD